MDSLLVYSSSRSMIEENKITNPFENYYFQQHENVAQDDGIKGVCDIELHLAVPVIEESIKVNILKIYNESVTLETLNSDSQEGLLLNLFSEREIHVPSNFEDARLQIDHHKLQEISEK